MESLSGGVFRHQEGGLLKVSTVDCYGSPGLDRGNCQVSNGFGEHGR